MTIFDKLQWQKLTGVQILKALKPSYSSQTVNQHGSQLNKLRRQPFSPLLSGSKWKSVPRMSWICYLSYTLKVWRKEAKEMSRSTAAFGCHHKIDIEYKADIFQRRVDPVFNPLQTNKGPIRMIHLQQYTFESLVQRNCWPERSIEITSLERSRLFSASGIAPVQWCVARSQFNLARQH